MTYRKKLIEVALPLEAINKASAREKSIRHGHPSTLHLWWARRPLAACRAVIFTSLVDDPNDPEALPEFVEACKKLPRGKNAAENDTPRQRLFDFIERLVTWEATTDEAILEQARELIRLATDGNPPPLLDPFAGGGSIPLEAQRLGLEAHASDLNPVAVMINKAMIEIPPKFANMPPVNPRDRKGTGGSAQWKGAAGLAADVRYYGEWIRDQARERIGDLYPKYNGETVIAWLWARTVKCPNPVCGTQMPLIRSFDLSKKKGKRAWCVPYVDSQTREITFKVKSATEGRGPDGTVDRRGAVCVACGTAVQLDYIRNEGQSGRMDAQLMAIVTESSKGRNYHAPNVEHIQIAKSANPEWKPVGELQGKCRVSVPLYGMNDFADLFTTRQLVALTTFSEVVTEARTQIKADAIAAGMHDDELPLRDGGTGTKAYAEALSVYLTFILDKQADLGNSLNRWEPIAQCPRQLFARQAIPMVWDFAEGNPFSSSSGSWKVLINNVTRGMESSTFNFYRANPGYAYQADATQISTDRVVHISTDPPYYDNIVYADLADFFYIWMRATLRHVYPDIFSTMLDPKEPELVATPFRFNGNKEIADQHFESGLMRAFNQIRQIIPPEYPLTVYYAFKQQEARVGEGTASTGWETMLNGLIETSYSILGTWPIRTEMGSRMVGQGTNALASSIVLVCRPRLEGAPKTSRREFVNDLRRELPTALREMQSGNIAPVDLAQASVGPGMAVYSRYSKVLEPNGEHMTVRTALQLINHELDAYLAEQEGYIDADSRFAVAWFEQFSFKKGPFGQADVLARAKNTSVEGLETAGVLESGAGKVRLLHWSELDPGWDPETDKRLTTWEATHHLIERLNSHGEEGAAQLLAKMPPDLAAEARQLAYRLYSICERKGWAENARDYNALVISWGASQEQAREYRDQYQQGTLF